VDDKAGTGMTDENSNSANLDSTFAHRAGNLVGNFVSSFAASLNRDLCVFGDHCGLITASSHPARNSKPPIGVIAPSQRTLVTAKRYRDPEKITIPAAQIQTMVGFRLAAQSAATACTRW